MADDFDPSFLFTDESARVRRAQGKTKADKGHHRGDTQSAWLALAGLAVEASAAALSAHPSINKYCARLHGEAATELKTAQKQFNRYSIWRATYYAGGAYGCAREIATALEEGGETGVKKRLQDRLEPILKKAAVLKGSEREKRIPGKVIDRWTEEERKKRAEEESPKTPTSKKRQARPRGASASTPEIQERVFRRSRREK